MKPEVMDALRELEHDDGKLLVSEVLDAARPETSILHGFFTWDDTEAANRWRFAQAEGLIRRYVIEVTVARPGSAEYQVLTRGYVASKRIGNEDAPAGTYQEIGSLTPMQRTILLARMSREIETLKRRYGHLVEFWEAISELDSQNPAA